MYRLIENGVQFGVLAIVCCAGCGRLATIEELLVDSRHRPIILTERRVLALPNALPGNRFVQGWRFEESDKGLRIRPEGSTTWLEVVQLADRERSLVLEVAAGYSNLESAVQASGPNGSLGRFEGAGDVMIPLPADLGPGRVPIELVFSGEVEIVGAKLSAAAPRGAVKIEGAEVIQTGWSAVEFVRWVAGDAHLVGEFVPPSIPKPRQVFSVAVNTGGRMSEIVFEMKAAGMGPSKEAQTFDLPLRESAGLVRVRLTASGVGDAGLWRNLRLVTSARSVQPPAPVPDPPRLVVVYVLDALRATSVGYLGATQGASPCIDRLASEGAAFMNHFSVAPNTGPATKSLFTGYGFLVGRGLSAVGPETLAEVFSRSGVVTASFSSNPHLSPTFGITRGFEHIDFQPLEQDHRARGKVTVNDSAERVHEAALRWLDDRKPDKPVFLYLHTLNPHNPYTPPEPFPSRFVSAQAARIDGRTRTLASIRDLERDVNSEDQEWVRQRYTSNLAYNDAELCGLVEELESRYPGEFMLVVTSDHGEELFDHDGVLHGYTLYDELLHVPLVVWWPGEVSPAAIESPTDTLDLHATLRSLIAPHREPGAEEGISLWGAISGSAHAGGEPRTHFATAPGLHRAAMARSERWKLILTPRPRLGWGMGRGRGRTYEAQYAFNLASDPDEHINLAGSPSLETDWLWSRLKAWEATWQARQPQDVDRKEIDEATRLQLEALGYVN